MALVVVEPRRVLIAALVGVGERTARLREEAVVESLLQLPRLTKPTGTSLSGHLVTYLSYLGLRRSPFPLRAASTWAVDPPFSHASPAPADRAPGPASRPQCALPTPTPTTRSPSICPTDGKSGPGQPLRNREPCGPIGRQPNTTSPHSAGTFQTERCAALLQIAAGDARYCRRLRALSSAGERCLHTAEAAGSKPAAPTLVLSRVIVEGCRETSWLIGGGAGSRGWGRG